MNSVHFYYRSNFCRITAAGVVLFVLVIPLLGCGGGSASKPQTQAQASSPPIVLSSVPANGASGVPTNEGVAVTFDQAMNPTTLTPNTFTISGVSGTVAYDSTNKTAVFYPSTTLAGNSTYSVTLNTGIKSAAGVALAQSYSFTFVTGTLGDTSPPTILLSSPANGATNVPLNTILSVTFSEAMDPLGLVGQTASGVSATLTYDSSTHTGTLTPSAKLAPTSQYVWTIRGNVKDLAGNPMGADYAVTFTTGTQ